MLEEDIREITSIPEKEMIFGKEEKERFDKETKCWICNKELQGIKSWICNEGIENIMVRVIVILLVGIEEPHATRVILTIKNLILRPWCFITLVVTIVIYL